jgi:hypothetical protein
MIATTDFGARKTVSEPRPNRKCGPVGAAFQKASFRERFPGEMVVTKERSRIDSTDIDAVEYQNDSSLPRLAASVPSSRVRGPNTVRRSGPCPYTGSCWFLKQASGKNSPDRIGVGNGRRHINQFSGNLASTHSKKNIERFKPDGD